MDQVGNDEGIIQISMIWLAIFLITLLIPFLFFSNKSRKKGIWVEGPGILCTSSDTIIKSKEFKRQLEACKKLFNGH